MLYNERLSTSASFGLNTIDKELLKDSSIFISILFIGITPSIVIASDVDVGFFYGMHCLTFAKVCHPLCCFFIELENIYFWLGPLVYCKFFFNSWFHYQ